MSGAVSRRMLAAWLRRSGWTTSSGRRREGRPRRHPRGAGRLPPVSALLGARHGRLRVGNPRARLMFVGEGPGSEEDRRGEPFVGAAGKRLDQWIARIGLRREDVYIANIVKCRPPGNRAPTPTRRRCAFRTCCARFARSAPRSSAPSRDGAEFLLGVEEKDHAGAREVEGTGRRPRPPHVSPRLHPAQRRPGDGSVRGLRTPRVASPSSSSEVTDLPSEASARCREVRVGRKGEDRLRSGHPVGIRGRPARCACGPPAGTWVRVRSRSGEPLGTATINLGSRIALRRVSRGDVLRRRRSSGSDCARRWRDVPRRGWAGNAPCGSCTPRAISFPG